MPRISVIFPAYNCEKYVAAALTSILAQEADLEVVAVDDGSTDATGAILDNFARRDARVRVFHGENQGVAAARNDAIARATGEWLAFCDGDDTVPPGAYQKLLRRCARTGADILVGDFRDASDSAGVIPRRSRRARGLTAFQTLFLVPCLWTKLMRREFILSHGIRFEDRTLGEDVVFLAEVAAAHPRVVYAPVCVYHHWAHDAGAQPSLTHQYRPELFALHLDCRERLLEICGKAEIPEARWYVYHDLTDFLVNFLFCMSAGAAQEQAFEAFRAFMLRYDWSAEPDVCLGKTGVAPQELKTISAAQYLARSMQTAPRDRVLVQFRTGQIGFSYILKYMAAWARYKMKK